VNDEIARQVATVSRERGGILRRVERVRVGFLNGLGERVGRMMDATEKLQGERELGMQQFKSLTKALEGMKERYEQEVEDYKNLVDARHQMEIKR
jgi:hypothetical protein